jgi:plastocyanin
MSPRRLLFVFVAMFATVNAVSAHAETIQVTMANVGYEPVEVKAHVGDTLEWINNDILVHTATARNKDFDIIIAAKKTGSVVLKTAGTIDYFCKYHPNMKGQIVVTPAP